MAYTIGSNAASVQLVDFARRSFDNTEVGQVPAFEVTHTDGNVLTLSVPEDTAKGGHMFKLVADSLSKADAVLGAAINSLGHSKDVLSQALEQLAQGKSEQQVLSDIASALGEAVKSADFGDINMLNENEGAMRVLLAVKPGESDDVTLETMMVEPRALSLAALGLDGSSTESLGVALGLAVDRLDGSADYFTMVSRQLSVHREFVDNLTSVLEGQDATALDDNAASRLSEKMSFALKGQSLSIANSSPTNVLDLFR